MDFEKFIKARRDEYDKIEHVPSDEMWAAIKPNIKPERKGSRIRMITRYVIAASLIGLFSAPFLVRFGGEAPPEESFVSSDPVFQEREQYYYELASEKKASLNFDELDTETYGDIIEELNSIDSMYADLKEELAEMPDATRAIESAIKYHERRLRILELLEREIENQNRNADHEIPVKI